MIADVWTQEQINLAIESLSDLFREDEYYHTSNPEGDYYEFITLVRLFISSHPILDPFDSRSLFLTLQTKDSKHLASNLVLKDHLKKDTINTVQPLELHDINMFKKLFLSCWNGELKSERANPWILQIHNNAHFTHFLQGLDQKAISPMITTLDGLFDYMSVTPDTPKIITSKTDIITEAFCRHNRDLTIEPFFGQDLLESLLWVYLSPEQRQVVSQYQCVFCADFASHWRTFVSTQQQRQTPNWLVLVTINKPNDKQVMALFRHKDKYYLVHHEHSLGHEFHMQDLQTYYIPLVHYTQPSNNVFELIALMYCHMHLNQGWGLDANGGQTIQVVVPRSIVTKSHDIMRHLWFALLSHAGHYHNMDKPLRIMFDLSYYYRINQANYDSYYASLPGVQKIPYEYFVNVAEDSELRQKIMEHHANQISDSFKNVSYPYIFKEDSSISPTNSCLALLMYLILKLDNDVLLDWIHKN